VRRPRARREYATSRKPRHPKLRKYRCVETVMTIE
jgi:hypothetical protein